MKQKPVATWHKLVDEVKNNPQMEMHKEEFLVEALLEDLDHFSKLPYFVISEKLQEVFKQDECLLCVQAMLEAGVFKLPYEWQLIEFDYKTDTMTEKVYCAVKQHADGKIDVYTMLYMNRDVGLCYVIPPFTHTIKFELNVDPETNKTEVGFNFETFACTYYKDQEVIKKQFKNGGQDLSELLVGLALRAVYYLAVVSNARGVAKEHIACEALNKKRVKRGNTRVPDHTVFRIGRVYDRSGKSSHYDENDAVKRRMPIHLRRGHVRHQRHGKGREQVKLTYIEPVLVNFKPDSATTGADTAVKFKPVLVTT